MVTSEHIYKYLPTCWFIPDLAGLVLDPSDPISEYLPDPSGSVPPFVPFDLARSVLIRIPSGGTCFPTLILSLQFTAAHEEIICSISMIGFCPYISSVGMNWAKSKGKHISVNMRKPIKQWNMKR